jgi:two-component system NtrC family sensor kinase
MTTSELEDLKKEVSLLKQRLQETDRALAPSKEEALRFDKLKTIEALSGSVVHQLGTALNIVTGYAHLIQDTPEQSEDVKEMAATIKQQADSITQMIRRLTQFGNIGPVGEVRRSNLSRITKDAVELFSNVAKRAGVVLTFSSFGPDAVVVCGPRLLEQAIAGMLRYVLEKVSKGSVVVQINDQEHAILPKEFSLEGYHLLSIIGQPRSDRASPILSPEMQGFSISNDIVHDYGGWIKIVQIATQGQAILTYLPIQVSE